MALVFAHDALILDASCVISLYASQQMGGILKSIPKSVTIAAYVYKQEALWIYNLPGKDEKKQREPIILEPYISSGLLKVVTIETEAEADTLATLSAKIRGQGEVSTGAIAINRNWAIAIDDRRARRLFQEVTGQLQLIYTLELMKYWVEVNAVAPEVITKSLQNIRHRAAYTPRNDNPLYEWWHEFDGG